MARKATDRSKRDLQRAEAAARRAVREEKHRRNDEQRVKDAEQRRFSPHAKTEWQLLWCTPAQKENLQEAYSASNQINTTVYDAEVQEQQDAARAHLDHVHFGANVDEREQRFAVVWSWNSAKKDWKRVLYQCRSGYSDQERRARTRGEDAEPRLLRPVNDPDARPHILGRLVPYPWTYLSPVWPLPSCCSHMCHADLSLSSTPSSLTGSGCLCHFEVVYTLPERHIKRISGILEHNEGCQTVALQRVPMLPLHPQVIARSLEGLMAGLNLSDVLIDNVKKVNTGFYPALSGALAGAVIHKGWRFLITAKDNKALARALCLRKHGVNTRVAPHINIHSWLQSDHPAFKPNLSASTILYEPLTTSSPRLKLVLATPDMREAAWRYAHAGQLVMDGTFGISSAKLLLFVVLAVDDNRRGLPIGYLLFTPIQAQATHSSYNTEILRELLSAWCVALDSRHGTTFRPKIAITDTDVRERAALAQVWPGITLRLCLFHVRQAWNNHKRRCTRLPNHPDSKAVASSFQDTHMAILDAADVTAARTVVDQLATRWAGSVSTPAAIRDGVQEHCAYLMRFWLGEAAGSAVFFDSFSRQGLLNAAARTGLPQRTMLTTTNHAEGFNNALKNLHLAARKQRGRPLRADMLLVQLILSITPTFYLHRRAADALAQARIALAPELFSGQPGNAPAPRFAFQHPDPERDARARQLCNDNLLIIVDQPDIDRVEATCFASATSLNDFLYASAGAVDGQFSAPTAYVVTISRLTAVAADGASASGSCQCPDWTTNGGACKHMRALLFSLPPHAAAWRLPRTEREVILLSHAVAQAPTAGTTAPRREEILPDFTMGTPHIEQGDTTADDTVPCTDEDGDIPNDVLGLIDWGEEESGSGNEYGTPEREEGVAESEPPGCTDELDLVEHEEVQSNEAGPAVAGIRHQARERMRADVEKAISLLAGAIRDSRALSLELSDWAASAWRPTLSAVADLVAVEDGATTSQLPPSSSRSAARAGESDFGLTPLPRESRRKRLPSTAVL